MQNEVAKLYSAYSVINDFHDRNNICFNWYCRNRGIPVAPYTDLIENFDKLSAEDSKDLMIRYVNSLFCEAEIQALRHYLHEAHEAELFVKRIDLPIAKIECLPFSQEETPEKQDTGFYMLSKEDDYNLSIDIWAYYDLNDCPLTNTAQEEQQGRIHGVRFLLAALKCLQMDEGIPESEIDCIVKQLYDNYGFNVTQEKD